MKIKIDYNTVSFETQILCNDETIQNNLEQTIEDIKNKRITDWFETLINRVKEESNNDIFSIEINGCDFYEKVFIDSVLERDSGLIDQKKINFLTDNSLQIKYKDVDAFVNYTLNSKEVIVKDAIRPNIGNIENLRSNIVEVPVIATMSSGKSTLLNALIGQDLLYEDTGTATATTCNIKINNKLKEFVAQAIDDEKLIEKSGTDISGFLKRWNSSANKSNYSKLKLNLEGPVKDINSSNLELNFIDTPGPNSSQYKDHKHKTFSYLKDNQKLPIVLYVLDPEKMESKDDDDTLKEISDVLKSNKENLDRIVFIYNKIDREELDKKPFSEVLLKILKFLSRYNIENPKIFPVSAKYAKLAQLEAGLSYLDEGDLINYRRKFIPVPERNYKGFQLLDYTPLTGNQKNLLKEKILKSESEADLVYSGLAAIKLYIEDYIINHHQKNQYKDLIDIAYKVFNVIESKIKLEKQNLEDKTTIAQKKREEKNQEERIELNKRKNEALQEISKIKFDITFIHDFTRKIDMEFFRLKNKSLKRNDLDDNQAKQLIEDAMSTISNLSISLQTDLISKMNDEGQSYLQKLKKEVINKFELKNPSLESISFNAELLNKINVLDINNIEDFKRTDVEILQREKTKEVTSATWYKRLFGVKDTITYFENYEVQKTVFDIEKFYKDIINPIGKQFNDIIKSSKNEFNKMFLEYNNSYKNLVIHSFDMAIDSVYKSSNKELALSIRDKEFQCQKLDEINKIISNFNKQQYNEKVYRKSTVTC